MLAPIAAHIVDDEMNGMRAFVRRRMSASLRRALRDVRMELHLERRHRAGVKQARRLGRAAPLRLNLGSGFQRKEGWLSIDLSDHADLTLDLRRRPFDPQTEAPNHEIGSLSVQARKPGPEATHVDFKALAAGRGAAADSAPMA
jgi:hypothetical protein